MTNVFLTTAAHSSAQPCSSCVVAHMHVIPVQENIRMHRCGTACSCWTDDPEITLVSATQTVDIGFTSRMPVGGGSSCHAVHDHTFHFDYMLLDLIGVKCLSTVGN